MKIEDLSLSSLSQLYGVIKEICQDYAKLTDNYALSTGDNKFENTTPQMDKVVGDRQRFFSYKFKVEKLLKEKIEESFMKNDFEE